MIIYRVSVTYFYSNFIGIFYIFSMIALSLMFLFLLLPLRIFLHEIRRRIIYQFWRSITPFTKSRVKFKDSLFVDILTSITRPFQSLTTAFCLAQCTDCKVNTQVRDCSNNSWAAFAFILLPSVLRLAQCINKYYYTKMIWPHMVNVGKYSVGITNIIISFLSAMSKNIYNR
jgi:hypothetical protein